jgi:hypothetical protein
MTFTKRVASGAVLAVLGSVALGSAAWADQSFTGTVTVLDRINNELAIKPAPAGETTGANAAGEVQKFRMRGAIPDTLHAEDRVTVSYTEAGGIKTITAVNPPKE